MTEKFNFTKRALEALALPAAGQRYTYYDTKIAGLGLRVTATGTKTFIVRRRQPGGEAERITLGTFPILTVEQARKMAQETNSAIVRGENPNDKKRALREELTLEGLYDLYLDNHIKARGKRTKNPESYWKLYLSPWAKRKLFAIKRADVRALHLRLGREKGAATGNKTLAMLRAMFNKAIEWELFNGPNPCVGIEKHPEQSRDRFLEADELPRFFQALAAEPNELCRDYFLLALLTGARRANLQAMRWEEINIERGVWTIPMTKNGEPHKVPLAPEALAILAARRMLTEGPWVFPSTSRSGHLEEPRYVLQRILQRAGIDNLRIHDLRRTLGSWQAATGASLAIIGKTLAHKNVSTTAIYARLNLDPVRAALETATRAMFKAGNVGDSATVIPLPKTSSGQE